jgi:hypothetical protein
VPDAIDQIGEILAVADGERAVEANLSGVFPQQPSVDGMEGPGPRSTRRHRSALPVRVHDARRDALEAARRLG